MTNVTNKEKETVNYNGLRKIFDFPPDTRMDERKISSIKKSTLFNFVSALCDSYINECSEELKIGKSYLDGFNSVIDDFVEDNEDVMKYYNINVFIFLKDFLSFYIERKDREKATFRNYISIAKNNTYNEIIKILNENKYITQNELARKANKSPQNLSNLLAHIKDLGVISSFKDTSDKRVTYYYLSHDFVKFLNKNGRILAWTDEYSKKDNPLIVTQDSVDEYSFRRRSNQEFVNYDETNTYRLRRRVNKINN